MIAFMAFPNSAPACTFDRVLCVRPQTAAAEAKYREAVADGDKANAAGAGAAPAAEARARLGLLMHRLGRVKEASVLLDAACEQRPDYAWGHVLAGQCWEAQVRRPRRVGTQLSPPPPSPSHAPRPRGC